MDEIQQEIETAITEIRLNTQNQLLRGQRNLLAGFAALEFAIILILIFSR